MEEVVENSGIQHHTPSSAKNPPTSGRSSGTISGTKVGGSVVVVVVYDLFPLYTGQKHESSRITVQKVKCITHSNWRLCNFLICITSLKPNNKHYKCNTSKSSNILGEV